MHLVTKEDSVRSSESCFWLLHQMQRPSNHRPVFSVLLLVSFFLNWMQLTTNILFVKV